MGILGFTSFVDHRCKALLQQEHINSCYLVIDGDNVAHHIFKRKPRSTGWGTDYASYASDIESFLLDLRSCEISAVVLLDGARDAAGAKLPRQLGRLTEKVHRSIRVAASRQREDIFPPLARTTFVQVARRLSVPVIQCPGEADRRAAAVARRLDCAVLSDDSDLCALGAPVVRLTPWQRPCTAPHAAPFMNCVVFRPERLLSHYNVSAEHLPLLATLPGNDTVPPAALDPFFRRLYAAHGSRAGGRERPGQRIKTLLRWLATQTSRQQALDKVLSTLPEKDRAVVEAHAALVAAAIADDSFEFLRSAQPELYGILVERAPPTGDPPPAGAASLPVAGAVLPASVLDAAGGAPALLEPAVEVSTAPAAALAAAPLLARLASLLAGRERAVTLYLREGRQVAERTVTAASPPLQPSGPTADPATRELELMTVLGVSPAAVAGVPAPLRLLAAALVVWRRTTAGRSSRRAVCAALLACVALAPEATLPPSADSVARWREKTVPLRQRPASAAPPLASLHLHYELQYVLLMAVAANEALGVPLAALDVDQVVHGPLSLALGFCAVEENDANSGEVSAPETGPRPDAALEAFVGGLADMIEEEATKRSDSPPPLTPGGSSDAVEDADTKSPERLSRLLAAARGPGAARGHKRARRSAVRGGRSKKRSRR
ncbi:protein asteroid homolog 1-like [Amphibalanus amphitrite]|uniref:protein asteroid homolog 1-like n=1 Tax=Amphibalanus amphitrite TaxID=1232801 RepID=UPI001C918541|nr:protein asteroid homolog 1-like [Amphibalanus amphitrite]